jgi:flagellar biosynthesis chaperone FliJ
MAAKQKYRLQVLVVLKERAKRDAESLLSKALRQLELEKKKLEELQEERKLLMARIEDEREKMRRKIAGGEALVKDPQFALNFVRRLQEDLEELEQKIEDQKETIKRAEQAVQRRRRDYMLAAQELNVMEKHRELWIKKMQAQLSAAENKMMNELGNVVHQLNKGK